MIQGAGLSSAFFLRLWRQAPRVRLIWQNPWRGARHSKRALNPARFSLSRQVAAERLTSHCNLEIRVNICRYLLSKVISRQPIWM
jgi:hypothetical protein